MRWKLFGLNATKPERIWSVLHLCGERLRTNQHRYHPVRWYLLSYHAAKQQLSAP